MRANAPQPGQYLLSGDRQVSNAYARGILNSICDGRGGGNSRDFTDAFSAERAGTVVLFRKIDGHRRHVGDAGNFIVAIIDNLKTPLIECQVLHQADTEPLRKTTF